MVQGGLQQVEIVGGGLLGEFDHHLARRNAEVAQQLQGAPRLVRRFHQGFRRDIQEQLARQLLLAEASARTFAAGHFQFAEAPGLAGHREQRDGGVQRAVGRATAKGFVAEDAPFGQADDRLEQAVQTALSQDRAQCIQLFGHGHGDLDRKKRTAGDKPAVLHFTTE